MPKTAGKDDLDMLLEEFSEENLARDTPGPLRRLTRLLRGGAARPTREKGGDRYLPLHSVDAGVTRGTALWF